MKTKEILNNDCLSKLLDGKQVEPASAKPGNVRVLKSTYKRLGADARIAHYGPASTYANYRGRIYVRSRAMAVINSVLAMRRSPYTDISEPSGIHQSILMSCSMRPRSVSRGAEEKHEVHTMINRSIIFTGGESK